MIFVYMKIFERKFVLFFIFYGRPAREVPSASEYGQQTAAVGLRFHLPVARRVAVCERSSRSHSQCGRSSAETYWHEDLAI